MGQPPAGHRHGNGPAVWAVLRPSISLNLLLSSCNAYLRKPGRPPPCRCRGAGVAAARLYRADISPRPPSMASVAPVTHAESFEHRCRIAAAISWGVPTRPSGCVALPRSRNAS